MGRNIRFELLAAAVLAFVPALVANATDAESDAVAGSCAQQVASLDARLARVEAALRLQEEGSASGEPRASGDDKAHDSRDADEQRFLHEVWTNP